MDTERMARHRFRYDEDDPEELALDWDLYERATWERETDGRWNMVGNGVDWDAVLRAFERRRRARLNYRRALLDGVCLEGSWGIGPWETVEHNGRYL